ncbi:MAG: hypothetical protein IKK81_03970 [Prevotella sp.]|nr:hypothetical protein [Prevotella sp.]
MNTTVIIIMIICATIIALVAIICDHLFERKSSEVSESLMSKKIIKIHRNYIAGFLGFAVIMLLTAQYGGPNNAIFEYLSFGSTITSLVLSILAIFVTVQSSSDLYKQFTRIDNATDTIKNVSSQIDDTLENLKDAERSLQNTSQNISQQLNNIVDQIDERLKTRMKETEGNISRQFAESMNVNANDQEQKIQQDLKNIEKVKDFFFSMTSANGLLAIYACTLSKEKKQMFELSKLFNGNEAYTLGFLIAAISTGLVHFTNDDVNNQITCHDTLFSSTETLEIIKNRLKQQQLGSEYLDRLNGIHIFFDLSPLKVTIE